MSTPIKPVSDTHWVAIARYAPDSVAAGALSAAHFALRTAELAPIANGQFLVRIAVASVDPYLIRLLDADGGEPELNRSARGVFGVEAIGTVVESRHGDYRVGDAVIGDFGWRQFVVSDGGAGVRPLLPMCASASLAAALRAQPSLALGALGMPGATAYFGLFKVLAPRAGQTLVVSACAGAVGSLVAQMAKSLGAQIACKQSSAPIHHAFPQEVPKIMSDAHFCDKRRMPRCRHYVDARQGCRVRRALPRVFQRHCCGERRQVARAAGRRARGRMPRAGRAHVL
jgi:NADPH-dependent curcumin reductase CurA